MKKLDPDGEKRCCSDRIRIGDTGYKSHNLTDDANMAIYWIVGEECRGKIICNTIASSKPPVKDGFFYFPVSKVSYENLR